MAGENHSASRAMVAARPSPSPSLAASALGSASGSPGKAAAVVGVFVFVQFLEGNFITPMITGSKVSINPMAAIIALILGGELWGTPGMILSIPLTAVLKVVMDTSKSTEPWGFLLGDTMPINIRFKLNFRKK